ncbi:threonine synthase [Subdoligranulum variabile]|uniref:Threonine synthase n=1 Tax=Subdoligranulum variabile DSM 15176 TaxID=411471 RepID=D1PKZ0_9FIRM|nr:threonine synthase [Subdoligranulum variabile]EFB76648.1 threonine synthase [Subdoligranulum variabile DSM 15176]UWP68121.1 threonine synthase [Subdoligranulum variabile]
MQYQSTRDSRLRVSASEAIVRGLAPQSGLFVPETFPQAYLNAWKHLSYPELAQKVLAGYLTDYRAEFLKQATESTYGAAFGGNAGRTVCVRDGVYALELWHGPTCAFKDYALQLMPKLLVEAKHNLGRKETTRILVATSGDTGKAALAGYAGLDGIEISVFYPNAGTSEIQRLQMVTQRGENVQVYAVEGNFDDAQTGVKRVFADASVAEELEKRDIRLSSANSINWGRLVPQIVYYFYAYFRLAEQSVIDWGAPVDFCVPTGNFGDILAGYYAKQMGLPVGKLICASNKNNVLTDFIRTGTYDARRTFYKTTSPSMDILISSNLERLLYHVSGSSEKVAGWMQELAQTGRYTVDPDTLARIQETFSAGFAGDEESAAEIRARFELDHYLCDTHTAVAFRVAETCRSGAPMVVLSTASPFKFPRDVLSALGITAPASDFDAMAVLTEATGQKAPKSLQELNSLPVRFTEVIAPDEIRAAALR